MRHIFHKNNLIFILFINLLLISCQKNDDETIINKTLDIAGYKSVSILRDKQNEGIKNTKRYVFRKSDKILKDGDENFITLSKMENDNSTLIRIYSYKTGLSHSLFFKNNKLIKQEEENVKASETKPFYLYYEILKRKYPNKMDWSKFNIPKDSLK